MKMSSGLQGCPSRRSMPSATSRRMTYAPALSLRGGSEEGKGRGGGQGACEEGKEAEGRTRTSGEKGGRGSAYTALVPALPLALLRMENTAGYCLLLPAFSLLPAANLLCWPQPQSCVLLCAACRHHAGTWAAWVAPWCSPLQTEAAVALPNGLCLPAGPHDCLATCCPPPPCAAACSTAAVL